MTSVALVKLHEVKKEKEQPKVFLSDDITSITIMLNEQKIKLDLEQIGPLVLNLNKSERAAFDLKFHSEKMRQIRSKLTNDEIR